MRKRARRGRCGLPPCVSTPDADAGAAPGRLATGTSPPHTSSPPASWQRKPAQVSFVAALAVADMVRSFVPDVAVTLKWPSNDPLIAGAKTAGILVESGALPDGWIWLAVGCGVNLAKRPVQSDRPVTALADHMDGAPPAPRDALLVLATAMESHREVWEGSGFAPIAAAWTARAHGLGDACTAHLTGETVHGIAEGLDPDGAGFAFASESEAARCAGSPQAMVFF